jgi:Putative threonine efflux protein
VAMYGIEALEALVSLPGFRLWAGLLGGLLLLAFGLGSLWKAVRPVAGQHEVVFHLPQTKPYIKWWLRGFLLNTVNPGTVFFWVGITSGVVVPNGWGKREMSVFFGGMFSALIAADVLKAWAAKGLRRFLTPAHTRQLQFGIGLLLAVFGTALMVQSVFFKQL